ncbi:50S ribosomal protein L1 [Candidatus Uhrbacteria bacterium RIFCSPHIGHO2_12_FULL_54_23]|uniref:Large ribosomal subunit protein uL1 n=1 Tax=Candidatus Uhrbacteria bacterium RIFCSPHIGHO2_12_FULL_54_23 TaxID=1802397 RepID=A0A1F7UIJ9_9BACT|nr:MAG: 50S ribosomal protein L1 [Candidatus Rokubacteria bacterium GWC2_70_16]OGL78072.1 MAG: 50S ribosomal protein L1 [Candidatus Uhrbacteria bacterium RIFCSPHIGHO2_12_FULL_54_23]
MSTRGKRYQEASKLIDPKKTYSIEEATELVKKTSGVKFDASVEAHFRLGIDPAKGEQQVRGVVSLPHGSGKSKRVAVFAEGEKQEEARSAGADVVGGKELIKEIRASEKLDFDVAVATPDMMKELAGIAKILGPKGLMPSPKNETVTADIAKTVVALKGGRVTFKNDDGGNVHQIVGKVSWDAVKLVENFRAFHEAVRRAKPSTSKGTYFLTITLTSSMGPGVRVSL